MKRSPMPPPDRTKQAAWRRRSKRLKPRSDKTIAALPEKQAAIAAAAERDRGCVPRRLDPAHRCLGPDTPHRLRKGSGGGKYVPGNVVILCAHGNTWVEDFPVQARSLGLVIR